MADQGNSVQHNVQNQSQGFASMAQPGLGMAQVAMSSEQAAPGRGGDGLGALAPIFPPQNFEVPDISFSNSVSPNADFNRSLFSAVQMFSASSAGAHYADVPPAAPGPAGGQQQGAYFPPPSNSPPGTSSSDDSDDLPLAQLAKRAIGSGTGVGSPSGLGTDTTSLENSPLSGTKKPKAAKKKKKKDPNEPQKPVSAYALFFRDTQATIKGHNPNASFGEVSKIVASMWDQLDPEHKDVYKKKTETSKKQYLKQLAAYRASQVSQQSAADESESSPSPPSVMSGMANVANSMPQALHSGASSQPAGHIPTAMSVLQQQMMMPHHQAQMQQLYPQMAAGQQGGSPSPPLQQRHSPVQQQQSSPPRSAQVYSSPPHGGGGPAGPNSYHQPMMDNNMYGYIDPESEMELTYPSCVRSGCGNYAKENPSWDSEYCSNDCVISHCRDIFTKWVASRTDTNSFPVK